MWISSWWQRRRTIDDQAAPITPVELPSQVTADVAHAVQHALAHLAGVWTVDVQPTAERGRWRVELRSPLGRHVWTCLSSADRLPELVEAKVRRFVRVASTHYHIRMMGESKAAMQSPRRSLGLVNSSRRSTAA